MVCPQHGTAALTAPSTKHTLNTLVVAMKRTSNATIPPHFLAAFSRTFGVVFAVGNQQTQTPTDPPQFERY